jgi:hypothetical protein
MQSESFPLSDDEVETLTTTPRVQQREVLQETPVELTTVEEVLLSMLGDKAMDYIAWGKEKYSFFEDKAPIDICKRRVDLIVHECNRISMAKERLGHAEIPPLQQDTITVGQLHTYLTTILNKYPDFANVPVFHEECCGSVETTKIKFSLKKGILVFL